MATNRDAARAGRRDGRAGPHLREDRGEARDVQARRRRPDHRRGPAARPDHPRALRARETRELVHVDVNMQSLLDLYIRFSRVKRGNERRPKISRAITIWR